MADEQTVQTEQSTLIEGEVAPTEIPELPETGEQKPEGTGEGEAQKQEQGEAKGWQRRVNKLTSEKYRAKAEAEQLARQNAELLQQLQAMRSAPQQATFPGSFEEFQKVAPNASYEQFLQAQSAHVAGTTAQQALQRAMQEAMQRNQQAQQQAAERAAEEAFEKRAEKARAAYADFDEATEWLTGQVPANVVAYLAQSENAADLLYHMGKNPQELERIKALPPVLQIAEVARLEGKAVPALKQTNAPKPIAPVKPTGAGQGGYRPDMSQEEYAQLRARRKGRIT